MNQGQLDRAVAQATGESVATIRRRGFSVEGENNEPLGFEPRAPQVVDWDALDEARGNFVSRCGRSARFAD